MLPSEQGAHNARTPRRERARPRERGTAQGGGAVHTELAQETEKPIQTRLFFTVSAEYKNHDKNEPTFTLVYWNLFALGLNRGVKWDNIHRPVLFTNEPSFSI